MADGNITRNPGETDEQWEARKREFYAQRDATPPSGSPGENTTEDARYGVPKDPSGYDARATREARDQFLNEYTNPTTRTAPQAGAPTPTNVTTAARTVIGGAAQAAPVTVAPAVSAPKVTVDTAQSDQVRQQSMDYLEELRRVAAGTNGPSAAELQLQKGQAAAIAAQAALAGQSHGYSTSALRSAGRNVAAIQQDTNAQAGILRATEAAEARKMIGGALATTRGQDIDVARANAGFSQETGLTYAQAQNRMKELQAQLTAQGGQFNAQQLNEITKLQAQIDATNKQFNAQETNTTARTDAELRLRTELANLDAKLKQEGLDDQQRRAALEAYVQSQGQILQADANYNQTNANKKETWEKVGSFTADAAKTAGVIATILSDKRAKTDIRAIRTKDENEFLEALGKAASYRYKGTANGPGERFGPMAQDLEQTRIGASMVRSGPDGTKRIDLPALTLAMAAMLGRMAKERRRK